MPIFRLERESQSQLVALAETGMGFQVIGAAVNDFDRYVFVAFSSQILVPAASRQDFYQNLREITELNAPSIQELRAREARFTLRPTLLASRLDAAIGIDPAVQELIEPQPLVTTFTATPIMAYFRFSAVPNDPRVDLDGNFSPGTYATTFNDLRMVPSGFAAVGRYALPLPLAARYVYVILTDSTPQLVGTSTPNFGQAGGGVEVLFPHGATAVHGRPHEISAS